MTTEGGVVSTESQAGPDGPDIIDLLLSRSLGVESERNSLVARIARETARDIIEGRIAPGAELTSIELANRFDTSRTPPREALLMLEREGLVEVRPRRRPRAVLLPRETVIEIYRLRAILYAVVARRLVVVIDDDGLAELQGIVDGMIEAAGRQDTNAYFWGNVMFHETASFLCGDKTLKQAIDSLGLRVLQLRHHGMTRSGRLERSSTDHARLMLALRERDSELAAALNNSIVINALPGVLDAYDELEQSNGGSSPVEQ